MQIHDYILVWIILGLFALLAWVIVRRPDPYRTYEDWCHDHGYDPEDLDSEREYCQRCFCRGIR